MKRIQGVWVRTLISILGMACYGLAAESDFDRAHNLYNLTEFDQSLAILQRIPDKTGGVWALIGRDYYGQGEFKKATEALEKAAALSPTDGNIALWLGRAWGRRAETSSMLTAPGYAGKARQCFERAVQLSPNSLDARGDLLEYYLEAPGFLGGGFDKAAATATEIARINPAEGFSAQARLAEKRKEYSSAEAHLRRAVELAPRQIGRFIDLARLLTRQGRYQEADLSLAQAEKVDPSSPRLLFAKADLYIRGKRNLDLARQLLERYLTCSLTPDDPPRSEARRLLKQVKGA
jgi:tetratricopeptide (TPR) repeat protein